MVQKQKKAKKKPPQRSAKPSQALAVRNSEPPALTKTQAKELQDGIVADLQGAEGKLVAAAVKFEKFRAGRGWIALGFTGLTEWREARVNFSEFYNARSAMKLLRAGVPAEQVERMKLTNINTMVRSLPPSSWSDQKILTLAEGPVAEFSAVAGKESDALGMNIEREDTRGFKASASIVASWDLALSVAKVVDRCEPMELRVEAFVANYLNGQSREPGMSRLQLFYQMTEGEKKAS